MSDAKKCDMLCEPVRQNVQLAYRVATLETALLDGQAYSDARIAKLEAYIARNCDPFDMTIEDAEFFRTVNPYALENDG